MTQKLEERIIDIINKTELHPMEYSVRQAARDILSLFKEIIEEAKPKEQWAHSHTPHVNLIERINCRACFREQALSDYHDALKEMTK